MHASVLLFWLVSLLAPFEQHGKWGFKDASGKVVIPPRYQMAQEFSPEGLAAVVDAQGWAYIDARARVVIRPLAVDNGPDEFSENLARFRQAGKVGFFDRRGKVVIPPRFAFALPFSEGRAAVCDGCLEKKEGEHTALSGGRWGYIDSRGTLVVPLQFEAAESFRNGRARVRLQGAWREIDHEFR
jgi:hypothetical protein